MSIDTFYKTLSTTNVLGIHICTQFSWSACTNICGVLKSELIFIIKSNSIFVSDFKMILFLVYKYRGRCFVYIAMP